ncbi:MAG: hypothetical protein HY558_06230 [Euryarchaeota archaeon]|nr:hypothetical protein [Euryarchaeota archaeon]
MALLPRVLPRVLSQEYRLSDLRIPVDGVPLAVSPTGVLLRKVFVAGTLREVQPEPPVYRGHIDDGAGTWEATAGPYQPAAASRLSRAQPGETVSTLLRLETGGPVLLELAPASPETLPLWSHETARRTLDRAEEMHLALASKTEPGDPWLRAARDHYRGRGLPEVEEAARRLLRGLSGPITAGEQVEAWLAEMDRGQGVPRAGLLARARDAGIPPGEAEGALRDLLESGRAYEPRQGTLRRL